VIGTVTGFSASSAQGTVATTNGNEYWFHCVAIADGTRTIAVGEAVTFSLSPGQMGRDEAIEIQSASALCATAT
jgi:cold shock CspA family protein